MFLSHMNRISGEGTDSTYHLVSRIGQQLNIDVEVIVRYLTLNNSQSQRSHQCLQRPVCHQFLFQEDVKAMKLNEPS